MTICCEASCQHPACWKAELDIQRSFLLNQSDYFNSPVYFDSSSSCRYDPHAERIVDNEGSLPTYKTLNLLEHGFPTHPKEGITEIVKEKPLLKTIVCNENPFAPRKSDDRIQSYPFTSRSLAKYLKKLCVRQSEVEDQELRKAADINQKKHAVFQTLAIEDGKSFGNEYTKVYTWIPGKKDQCEDERGSEEKEKEKEKELAMMMIDGADLPTTRNDENKHRHKLRSPNAGLEFRKRAFNLIPLGCEDHEDYLELLHYLNLTQFTDFGGDKINNDNVRIPTPLQSAKVKLHEAGQENKVPKQPRVKRKREERSPLIQKQDLLHNKQKTLEDGKTDAVCTDGNVNKDLKRQTFAERTKRTLLPLTRVSVPKKIVRKLPLFDHCSSSIKKKDLPEVTMMPLSGSETTSVFSMDNNSVVFPKHVSKNVQQPEIATPKVLKDGSSDFVRVPATSPFSLRSSSSPLYIENNEEVIPESSDTMLNLDSPNILPPENLTFFDSDCIPGERSCADPLERNEPTRIDTLMERTDDKVSGKMLMDFDGENQLHTDRSFIGNRDRRPSAIMITKETKDDLRGSTFARRYSPTLSVISKGSLDGVDKDIIARTYDQYQSFTPFKTPQVSTHLIGEKKINNENKISRPRSQRQILPLSLHNLDQFLPGEEESLRTNTSFITRTLSPSRSLFIRQQKQPPRETVPSEIAVSRFPILPAIPNPNPNRTLRISGTKSAMEFPRKKEPIVPSFRYGENPRCHSNIQFLDDDDETDDVEEILLQKLSSCELDRLNTSPQTSPQASFHEMPIILTSNPSTRHCEPETKEALLCPSNVSRMDLSRLSRQRSGSNLVLNIEHNNDVTTAKQKKNEEPFDADPAKENNNEESFDEPQDISVQCAPIINVPENTVIECTVGTEQGSKSSHHIGEDVNLKTRDSSHLNVELLDTMDSNSNIAKEEVGETYNDIEATILMTNGQREENSSESNHLRSKDKDVIKEMEAVDRKPSEMLTTLEKKSNDTFSVKDCDDAKDDNDLNIVYKDSCSSSRHTQSKLDLSKEVLVTTTGNKQGELISNEENIVITEADNDRSLNVSPADTIALIVDEAKEDDLAISTSSEKCSPSLSPVSNNSHSSRNLSPGSDSRSPDTVGKVTSGRSSARSARSIQAVSYMRLYGSSSRHLPDEHQKSVMQEIFDLQLKQTSSLYLTPKHAEDFTQGLDLDMRVDEDIERALQGEEEFVLDSYEIDDEDYAEDDFL